MEKSYLDKILMGTSVATTGAKDVIINYTKSYNDVAASNLTDIFMDQAVGRGHRIVHGHDFSNLPEIYNRFGLEGVGDFFAHNMRDLMSPDGIPVPFANEIKEALGLTTGQSIDWLCLNAVELLTGSLSVAHSVYAFNGLMNGDLSALNVATSGAIKILTATLSPNPIVLAAGVFDIGLVIYHSHEEIYEFAHEFFKEEFLWSDIFSKAFWSMLWASFVSAFGRFILEARDLFRKKTTPKQYAHKHGVHILTDGFSVGIGSAFSNILKKYDFISGGLAPHVSAAVASFTKLFTRSEAQKLQVKMGWLSHTRVNSDFILGDEDFSVIFCNKSFFKMC
jgi:hypothetical protein